MKRDTSREAVESQATKAHQHLRHLRLHIHGPAAPVRREVLQPGVLPATCEIEAVWGWKGDDMSRTFQDIVNAPLAGDVVETPVGRPRGVPVLRIRLVEMLEGQS